MDGEDGEQSFDNAKGIHYGTGSTKQVSYIQLLTSDISGTITKVVVNASTASGVTASVSVTVGGNAFGGDPQSLTSSAADYTFTGSATGEIVVRVEKPSSAYKALYVKSVVVTYTTSSGGSVNLTANEGATGEYWATYYNGTTSYTADANTTVYKAALNGTSSLTLTEVANREIPADKAVILKSTSSTITLTPAASTTADLSDNVLKGGTTVTSGCDAYTLSRGSAGTGTVGFYKFNGGALDGSKAHLEILSSSPAPARGFIGFGDDGTTAIEAPTATVIVEDGEIYDLTGRRIEGQPTRKGIYVKNGQKFIVK